MARVLISLLLFVILSLAKDVEGIIYCHHHQFEVSQSTMHMQLTKEAVSKEYAVIGAFKSLHCCAKGYRSIEWFKNGKPYPWPNDISSLILYPEEENQTIYTRSASFADEGNYSCRLTNDTHIYEYYVDLNVRGSLPDTPLVTFRPQNVKVSPGDPARLYCEAFVGKVMLPDARSSISWYQMLGNKVLKELVSHQETITREDDQIVGAYLFIPHILRSNYGPYLCRIEIGNSAHRLEIYADILEATPTVYKNNSIVPSVLLAILAAIVVLAIAIIGKYLLVWVSHRQKFKMEQCLVENGQLSPALRDLVER